MSAIAQEKELKGIGTELGALNIVRGRAWARLRTHVTANRQERSVSIIVEPGTELMGAAQTLNTPVVRMKHPGRLGIGLQRPVRHAEGKSRDGKRTAARKLRARVHPLHDIYEISKLSGFTSRLFSNCR